MPWRAELSASSRFLPLLVPGAAALLSVSSAGQDHWESAAKCEESKSPESKVATNHADLKDSHATLPPTAFGQAKLCMVQVIFRHGARTPLTANFWDGQVWDCCGQPYKAAPLMLFHKEGGPPPHSTQDARQVSLKYEGGCHKGELTILGKIQAYELGKWLRSQYCDQLGFLPQTYEEGLIAAHTTNVARTIQTLTGVVSALYSDIPDDRPLHVTTAAENEEFMYANGQACPMLKQMLREKRKLVRASPEMAKLVAELEQKSGGAVKAPINIIDMYDAYTSIRAHGKQLPEWVDASILHKIEQMATSRINAIMATASNDDNENTLLHMAMGRLLQELVSNIESCIAGQSRAKIHLYSGHDTTVLPLLAAFGMDLDHWPPYASHVVLELWEVLRDGKTEYYVRGIYNKEEVTWPGLVPGEMCSLDRLKDYILHRFLEHDPNTDCDIPDQESAVPITSSMQQTGTQF